MKSFYVFWHLVCVEWSNLWVIWVSLCHEFVKSDDLEHYGLNKKAPNTVQDAATAQ